MSVMKANKDFPILLGDFEGHSAGEWPTHKIHICHIYWGTAEAQ